MKTSITSSNERIRRHLRAADQNIYAAAVVMETHRRGGRVVAHLPCQQHVCKHALGVRAPVNQLERCSISHIHLQNGTFPGKRRRLAFTSPCSKASGKRLLLRRGAPRAPLAPLALRLLDGSNARRGLPMGPPVLLLLHLSEHPVVMVKPTTSTPERGGGAYWQL